MINLFVNGLSLVLIIFLPESGLVETRPTGPVATAVYVGVPISLVSMALLEIS